MSRGRVEREGDTESEAGSRLWTVSTEPEARLEPINHKIMTWAKVRGLTNWATQAPFSTKPLNVMLGDRASKRNNLCLERNFSFKHNLHFEETTSGCNMTVLALCPLMYHKCHMKPWKEPHQVRLDHWELQGNHVSHTWFICGPLSEKASWVAQS